MYRRMKWRQSVSEWDRQTLAKTKVILIENLHWARKSGNFFDQVDITENCNVFYF